jgi:hypothetical protein
MQKPFNAVFIGKFRFVLPIDISPVPKTVTKQRPAQKAYYPVRQGRTETVIIELIGLTTILGQS